MEILFTSQIKAEYQIIKKRTNCSIRSVGKTAKRLPNPHATGRTRSRNN
jgi:hypothetical protein